MILVYHTSNWYFWEVGKRCWEGGLSNCFRTVKVAQGMHLGLGPAQELCLRCQQVKKEDWREPFFESRELASTGAAAHGRTGPLSQSASKDKLLKLLKLKLLELCLRGHPLRMTGSCCCPYRAVAPAASKYQRTSRTPTEPKDGG